ncbi:MAG TPA: carbon-nitrogen hydrolase family protein [Blastocatellia bacterium]|nr:carbon-nitrogen hydrolase family protein [Blastocatellia bacterium]
MAPSMVNIAAVQAAPVYLNLERSLAKALNLISEAAMKRAQLVAFPETWLPGYPAWLDYCRDVALWDHPPVKKLYARLVENSVVIPGPVTETIAAAAREHQTTVVIGVNERVTEGPGRGTLYNTLLTFGPTGLILNRHRKMMPTFSERLIWGQGDGTGLRAAETPAGRVGGLICWEHWMPLPRQVMHNAGEDIHVAAWPAVKEMHQVASRHYAFEGRCFVLAVGGIMRARDLPGELEPTANLAANPDAFILNGGSAVIGPDGHYVAGPAFDCEALVMARVNLERIREESMTLDVTGHYSRPDLFEIRTKGDGNLAQTSNGSLPHSEPPEPSFPRPFSFDVETEEARKH